MNIDTEGNEFTILQNINFDIIQPLLISIEDNSFDLESENKNNQFNGGKKLSDDKRYWY